MNTKQAAIEALDSLWDQAGSYLLYLMIENPKLFDQEYDKRTQAYELLLNLVIHRDWEQKNDDKDRRE